MKSALSSTADEALLLAALHGDQRSWTRLEARFRAPLRKLACRWCPDLPNDVREEVAQEVWAEISRRRIESLRTYEPASERAMHFIASFVPNAAQKVHSIYRAAGTRSRKRRCRSDASAVVPPRLGWAPVQPSTLDKVESVVADPSWEDRLATHDARIDVTRVAAAASPAIGAALVLVLNHGATFAEAASSVGLSTSTFIRRLTALVEVAQLAA